VVLGGDNGDFGRVPRLFFYLGRRYVSTITGYYWRRIRISSDCYDCVSEHVLVAKRLELLTYKSVDSSIKQKIIVRNNVI
jgi:hypothetical protein